MKLHAEVDSDISPLTKKENQVFGMLAEGLSQREMSDRLHRSFATVSTHIEHIKQKLDADNSTQAVSIGVLDGFLSFSKRFAIYGLIVSSVGNLIVPSSSYAGGTDIDPPTERVRGGRGGMKINRVFGRGRVGRKREDSAEDLGLELFVDEE